MDKEKVAKELVAVAKELTAARFTFKPQYEFGLSTNNVNVYSKGKLIGYVEAKDVAAFKYGKKVRSFEPIKYWQHSFSPALMEELGLERGF